MSFSRQVKNEISEQKLFRQRYKHALAYGLFSYSNHFSVEEISLNTRQQEVAEAFGWLAKSILGKETTVTTQKSRAMYRVFLPLSEERERLIDLMTAKKAEFTAQSTEDLTPLQAVIAGAFLACGHVSDPAKIYHLEFVTKSTAQSERLLEILRIFLSGVRATTRRGFHILYCKERSQIQDLLTLMGAVKSSLSVVDVELYRDLRNLVNRQTNSETANISKRVSAATEQIYDIEFLIKEQQFDSLQPATKQAALLRRQHPESTMRELVELSAEKTSLASLHRRLADVKKSAQKTREQKKRKEKANV